jgi:transcriptional regulator with XRE-family HTH domain
VKSVFFISAVFSAKIILFLKTIISYLFFLPMQNLSVENVIKKITAMRSKKGFTYENMANALSISPASYRKLEIGETNLTLDRLFKLAVILETPISDLLEIGNDVFQQTNQESATGYQQKIENFYQERRDVYEKLIKSKDEQLKCKDEQICLMKSFWEKGRN